MEVGDRSVVIVQGGQEYEASENEFCLAIVAKESSGYKVGTMEGYLEGLMGKSKGNLPGVLEFWKRNTANVGDCDSEEVEELLPVMERNSKLMMKTSGMKYTRMSWDH